MSLGPFQAYADSLAPGDRGVLAEDWSRFSIEVVRSPDQAAFAEGYGRLWDEFGERGEMEQRAVIEARLRWDPRRPVAGRGLSYEMVLLRCDGQTVAVRDHTAIVAAASDAQPSVTVHLSHVLVVPQMRGRGLAAWLRALPVATARDAVAAAAGASARSSRITLVAEMEHASEGTAAVAARLRSYARAGFAMADPARCPYAQPDFRSAAAIDASEVQPIPMCLVLRRVGCEHEPVIHGAELRATVAALYAMFAVHVRPVDMRPLDARLAQFPAGDARIALLSPTAFLNAAQAGGQR